MEELPKKVCWIQISPRRYGGVIYGEEVRKALTKDFDVELKITDAKYLKWKYLKPFEWVFNLIRLKGKKDLWIRDNFLSISTLPFDSAKGKNLAIVYHIDFAGFPLAFKPFYFLVEKLFYYSLKRVDAIVTICNYWQNHFLERGYNNVYKIYNGFDLADFEFKEEEVLEFKKRFNLDKKPIVYLGNCQESKGVVEAYHALKDLDLHLVTSGEEMVKIPALNLNLEYRDYLKLLKASSIVLEMSKFKSGWSRTAQEAMLLKTPVISLGLGGIGELIEDGKQMFCESFNSLGEKVEYLLERPEIREKIGEDGYSYAKNLTLDKFGKEWSDLIGGLIG